MPDKNLQGEVAEAALRLREPAMIAALALGVVRIMQQVWRVVSVTAPEGLPLLVAPPFEFWLAFVIVALGVWCVRTPVARRARGLVIAGASFTTFVALCCVALLVVSLLPGYRSAGYPIDVSEWVMCAIVYGLAAWGLWFLAGRLDEELPGDYASYDDVPETVDEEEPDSGPAPVWQPDQAVARSWSRAGDAASGAQADQWGARGATRGAIEPQIDQGAPRTD